MLARFPEARLRQTSAGTTLGPHQVIKRIDDRTFAINVEERETVVSIERLKPAHLASSEVFKQSENNASQHNVPVPNTVLDTVPDTVPVARKNALAAVTTPVTPSQQQLNQARLLRFKTD